MGAWGPAIFSDDTTVDIRGAYRELLEDQVPDDEATREVLRLYADVGDEDEGHLLWLGLAAAQHQVGRLDDDVKQRAVDVIDSGQGLELWAEAGPKELEKRQAALQKLRDQLTGPQPPRKTIRRPWRHVTELEPGMVLAYTATSGTMALFLVVGINDSRHGVSPTVERLDWRGHKPPSAWRLRRLKAAQATFDDRPPRDERYVVSRHRKKDPDWDTAGFTIVGKDDAPSNVSAGRGTLYTQWDGLASSLELHLGPRPPTHQ